MCRSTNRRLGIKESSLPSWIPVWTSGRERTASPTGRPLPGKVLLCYHNIYRSWSWLGGHADGEHDLLAVAEREVLEESGLSKVTPLSEKIFSLEILTVDGHEKRGVYVPSHLHLNVTYLLQADPEAPLSKKADENSAVAWFPAGEAVEASSEPWFRERIYPKLNEKMARFFKNRA